jgi:hypothetical protein
VGWLGSGRPCRSSGWNCAPLTATTTDVYIQEINSEGVTRGTSVLLPNATKLEKGNAPSSEGMVDLVGIEPTTSSMPWKNKNRKPLPVQYL